MFEAASNVTASVKVNSSGFLPVSYAGLKKKKRKKEKKNSEVALGLNSKRIKMDGYPKGKLTPILGHFYKESDKSGTERSVCQIWSPHNSLSGRTDPLKWMMIRMRNGKIARLGGQMMTTED